MAQGALSNRRRIALNQLSFFYQLSSILRVECTVGAVVMKRYFAIAIVALAGCAPMGVEPPAQVAVTPAPVAAPPPAAPAPVALVPVAPVPVRVPPPPPPMPPPVPVHVAMHHMAVVHHLGAHRYWYRRVRTETVVWAAPCGSVARPCTQEHQVLRIE
jgi:hypothetical protein